MALEFDYDFFQILAQYKVLVLRVITSCITFQFILFSSVIALFHKTHIIHKADKNIPVRNKGTSYWPWLLKYAKSRLVCKFEGCTSYSMIR